MGELVYRISPSLTNDELNALHNVARQSDVWQDFESILNRSLAFVCAYDENQLVGFVNVAWDGGLHGFILDTLVHPDFRLRGIGLELVRQAVAEAKKRGLEWIHVDFEPHLQSFYDQCGFKNTAAGLIRLKSNS